MNQTKSKDSSIFILLLFFLCTSKIGTGFYIPSIPSIAKGLSTSINNVQFCMSIYMFGVAISQIIYGPLSEAFGRRLMLLIGFFIMSVGSLAGFLANSIEVVTLGRFAEGIGAGACYALWRAVARDNMSGKELAKEISYLAMVMIITVPVAPILGGYLDKFFGWRYNFLLMACFTFFIFVFSYFKLPETNIHRHRNKFKFSYIMQNYKLILASKRFMYLSFGMFLFYGGFFSWLLIGSVILIKQQGMSPPTFAWINFFVIGGTRFVASYINSRVVNIYGLNSMIRFGCILSIIAGIIMIPISLTFTKSVWALILPTMLYFAGMSFFSPNAFAESFTPHGDKAGYAGAVYGSIQVSGASIFGMLVSLISKETPLYLALIFLFCSSFAWILFEKAPEEK